MISQVDQAHHDTLLHKSDGWTFDWLSEMFGFARPAGIDRSVWRHALRAVGYGHRGTPGSTWAAIELGLRTGSADRTVQVSLSAGSPHAATFVSGSGDYASGFTCAWVGRFVRLRRHVVEQGETRSISKILYVVGPVSIASGSPSTTISFAPTATSIWDTEDCAGLSAAPASIELLPFSYREPSPGPLVGTPTAGLPMLSSGQTAPAEWVSVPAFASRCVVELEVAETEYALPATYLLDPGGVDRATFPGQPLGGIIMDQIGAVNDTTGTLVEIGDPLGSGPSPLYLLQDAAAGTLARHFDALLASGVELTIGVRDFCLFEGSGTGAEEIFFSGSGALADPRLAVNSSAPGVVETQSVWPSQTAYVFSGGNGSDTRYLVLVSSVTDKTIEWTYAVGAQPGTDWDDPQSGEELVMETSATGSAPWTVVWTGSVSAGPSWLSESVHVSGTKYVRWRQLNYTASASKSDTWAIGQIRVIA